LQERGLGGEVIQILGENETVQGGLRVEVDEAENAINPPQLTTGDRKLILKQRKNNK
jgi:hypothetical protein